MWFVIWNILRAYFGDVKIKSIQSNQNKAPSGNRKRGKYPIKTVLAISVNTLFNNRNIQQLK